MISIFRTQNIAKNLSIDQSNWLLSLAMRWLYTVLYTLGFVLLSPLFLYTMWKRGKYRENFGQRFGGYSAAVRARLGVLTAPCCWIQAVSVGEVNLALPLLAVLRRRFPQHRFVLTTTTSTGYALARERLAAPGGEVELFYFPQDFPWTVRRAFDLIRPDFIVLLESEIWPNHVWEAARRRVPVFVVNARMAPKSARRHQRCRWPFARVWPCLRRIGVQSQPDLDYFLAAGVSREKLHLTGNLKYDNALPPASASVFDPASLLAEFGVTADRPVLVAGSTHPGEEEILFDTVAALRAQFPNLFLVLVPRHVERAAEILELARRKQVSVALRQNGGTLDGVPDCLLVNTTGELRRFYEIATVIFVGKSLCGVGGQNIVEAAASGHPVIFGPHMENFREIACQFVSANAAVQVQDVDELRHAIRDLLQSEPLRERITAAAAGVIEANCGATERTVALIADALAVPGRR